LLEQAPAHTGPTPGRIAELHNRNPDVAALLHERAARFGWFARFPRFLSFAW